MKKTMLAALGLTAASAFAITDTEIEALLQKMTLEEKVGQLVQFCSGGPTSGAASEDSSKVQLPSNVIAWVKNGQVGSLIGACGLERFNEIQRLAVEESRCKIPVMVGHDMIHGVMTQLPIPLALACTWNEEVWFEGGRLIALEAPYKGCNWTFAPMVDVCRDPRWGRIAEGPGQDAYLGGVMAAATVKGIQSKDVATPIAACIKHYAAYGASDGGRDYNTVDMSESRFRNFYLPPYKEGVAAGALTVMPAFHSFNGVPCSVNKWLLTDVLRGELGFKGYTISDWDAIGEQQWDKHGMGATHADCAKLALEAGMDQDMFSGFYQRELPKLVRDGKVKMETLDQSVRNILRVKNALGLFENPYLDKAALEKQIDLKAHAALAREVAAKTFVLLKNKEGVLPLKKGVKVALVGPGAEDEQNISGMWTSYIENKSEMLITEGLKGAGVEFTYTAGYDFKNPGVDKEALKKAVDAADVVVALMGEHGNESGEGWSRRNVELPKVQLEAFEFLRSCGKPIVVLLSNGRPLAIPELAEGADAILEIWSPGTSGGGAVADVLTGKVNPSGRLTTEFPYTTGQLPLYYNRNKTGRPADTTYTGMYLSCYRDGPYGALYPFGYGLSYTSFAYANEEVKVEGEGEQRRVVLACDVTNTGAVPGVETVQVYTREMIGRETRPVRELRGWKQVSLKAGETQRVTIEIPVSRLTYWCGSKLVPAEGAMRAWVCHDSVSGKELTFNL